MADLIAYPITQHLLYPGRVNFAYDIINDNIYESEGKKLGLKVIPHLEEEQKKRVEISLQPFSDRGHPSPFNWARQFDANIRIIYLPANFSSASASSSPMSHMPRMS